MQVINNYRHRVAVGIDRGDIVVRIGTTIVGRFDQYLDLANDAVQDILRHLDNRGSTSDISEIIRRHKIRGKRRDARRQRQTY